LAGERVRVAHQRLDILGAMSSPSVEEPRRLDINWVQTLAGALAAVSSAVLLSTLGVAGTIIGAAAGSIVVTVGNAVYSHYLDVSKERAAAARQAALEKANQVRARSRSRTGAGTVVTHDDAGSDAEAGSSTPQSTRPTWREAAASLRWGRVAATVAAVFALAMAAILTFEVGAGHPVSYYTGGSSADGPRTSFGGGSGASADKPDQPTDSGESTPSPDAPNQSGAPTEPTHDTDAPTTPAEETTEAPTTQPTTPAPTTAPPTAGSTPSPSAAAEPTEP
jgi:hypothetical protein